jgi:transposase
MEELWTMSTKELDRAAVMARLVEGSLTQRAAAEALAVSVRQVRRLLRGYEAQGAGALASKRRGRPSNRRLPTSLRDDALALVRERYADFGPTLACEKLRELHGVCVSSETLRTWMTVAGLWSTRAERRKRPQPPRARRDCFGELVQIDGCDHDWFEGRGPRCTLLVFVDDATGQLMELRFARSETTFDYFAATEHYLRRYGKPVAFYSDKASIFRVNAKEALAGVGFTQFGRAMKDLNIDVICANSPAAKGRVERAHQTLQDRLVKELRLHGISDREAGNALPRPVSRGLQSSLRASAKEPARRPSPTAPTRRPASHLLLARATPSHEQSRAPLQTRAVRGGRHASVRQSARQAH